MNRTRFASCLLLPAVLALPLAAAEPSAEPSSAQSTAQSNVALSIEVAGSAAPFALTSELLRAQPRRQATVPASEHGPAATYEGVDLRALLTLAGVPEGKSVRGKVLTWAVFVGASDGYEVVFTLAELEPAFSARKLLLADLRDGKPLGEGEGPYRLVVEGDQRPARSARLVNRIRVGPATLAP